MSDDSFASSSGFLSDPDVASFDGSTGGLVSFLSSSCFDEEGGVAGCCATAPGGFFSKEGTGCDFGGAATTGGLGGAGLVAGDAGLAAGDAGLATEDAASFGLASRPFPHPCLGGGWLFTEGGAVFDFPPPKKRAIFPSSESLTGSPGLLLHNTIASSNVHITNICIEFLINERISLYTIYTRKINYFFYLGQTIG